MLDAFIIERIRRQREQQDQRTPLRIEVPPPPPEISPPRRTREEDVSQPDDNPYNVDFSV